MGNFGKELLQLLDLLLRGGELFGNDTDVLARGKVFGLLCLSGSRGFATNIIEIVFAIYAKVRVLKFEYLRQLSEWDRLRVLRDDVVHCRWAPSRRHRQMA